MRTKHWQLIFSPKGDGVYNLDPVRLELKLTINDNLRNGGNHNGKEEMFDYGILQDAGKVSAEIAKLHAETEFEKYRVIQDRLFMSDFDKYMLELEENTKK